MTKAGGLPLSPKQVYMERAEEEQRKKMKRRTGQRGSQIETMTEQGEHELMTCVKPSQEKKKKMGRSPTVAHTCNPSKSGGQGRRITSSKVGGQRS